MDYGISDKAALVVGGSKGMGFEVAKMLAAEGCRLAVLARTRRDVEAAARMGQPQKIASLIAYLCSEAAGYITGAWIEVDGGLHRSAF